MPRIFLIRFAKSLILALVFLGVGHDDFAHSKDADQTLAPFQSASWIAPPADVVDSFALPLFRKEFTANQRPKKVILRIIGLGDFDALVNGQRLSSTGINQPWSQYEKTIYCREYDITKLVQRGVNCVGVMLANSFWDNHKPPEGRYYKPGPQRTATEPLLLLAEIVIENGDGSIQKLGTDSTWQTDAGPVVFSHIYAGEDYDSRREQPGWALPAFDSSGWQAARLATDPGAELRVQDWPPIEVIQTFKQVSITEPESGIFVYSFPQNCAAQLRVHLSGGDPAAQVTFRCGEHKNLEGRLFGNYVVDCNLTTNGDSLTHQWLSFYLGMQFVEVSGAVPKGNPNPQGLPVIESMELVQVRISLPVVGEFHCASELYNGTHQIVDWAMQSNSSHVLTDCPHREKLGWLEVSYLMARSFQYRYGCREWFDKILQDIRDAQEPSGRVLTVAPSYPAGQFPDKFDFTVEWGAAAVLLPWQQYEWTGDSQVLRENFDMMRRFVDYVTTVAVDGIAPEGLGDWYDYGHGKPPGPSRFTPPQLTATATWAICAQAVARAAEILGKSDEAKQYHKLYAQISRDFQDHFRDPATGDLKHLGSPQCANAIALCSGVVPEVDRAKLVEQIISDLEQRKWQQTSGDVGHVYFIRALAEAGRSDVLHRVYSRTGLGSYGGILKNGLTTMPETWDAIMDGYQSLNHCMLGHVMEWYYAYVAGIRQNPGSVGWKDILIAPNSGPLPHAEARLTTPSGEILSRWKVQEDEFQIEIEIPAGISALAILPSGAEKPLQTGFQKFTEPWQAP